MSTQIGRPSSSQSASNIVATALYFLFLGCVSINAGIDRSFLTGMLVFAFGGCFYPLVASMFPQDEGH